MRFKTVVTLLLVAACSEEHGTSDESQPARDAESAAEQPATTGPDKCEVTTSNPVTPGDAPRKNTWTYDAATRRLVTTIYAYDIDEFGRTTNVYGIERGSLTRYWTNHYDEHGKLDSNNHYTSGTQDYRNSYDAQGRLESVEVSGIPGELTTYHYEDPTAPEIWTRSESDVGFDGTIDGLAERKIADGRTDTVRATLMGKPAGTTTFKYAGDRIDTIERDGGLGPLLAADGKADISYHWKRDTDGNVVEFTQDGTTSFDNPVVNGNPDYVETFSEGCASLLKQFPWLSHEPAPNSTGPRFRDNGD